MADYFRLKFTIEGVPELGRILQLKQRQVSNLKKPLFKSGQLILADVEQQFRTEGGLSDGWQPLALGTVKGRLREGYGGKHPILQRTGALRRSFFSRVSNKMVFISASSPYFGFHQSRKPRATKLPRRPMLLLTQRTKENIQEEFNKFLRFK